MTLGQVAVLIVAKGHAAAADEIYFADGVRSGKCLVVLARVVAH